MEKQSAQGIDVVSGATYSSKAIAEAAQQALMSMEERTE
jgi:major membrane immunogen (membrane-anchored lipoprotein)